MRVVGSLPPWFSPYPDILFGHLHSQRRLALHIGEQLRQKNETKESLDVYVVESFSDAPVG